MTSIWNVIGIFGAIAIISAYGLLQFQRWQATDRIYSATNALGASMILISLAAEPNLPSIFIESFWLLISVIGMLQGQHRRNNIETEDKG
jgi:hypothetical protein